MPLADGTIVELTKLVATIPSARLHIYIPITMPREKIFGTLRCTHKPLTQRSAVEGKDKSYLNTDFAQPLLRHCPSGANWTVDRMRCPSPELIETMAEQDSRLGNTPANARLFLEVHRCIESLSGLVPRYQHDTHMLFEFTGNSSVTEALTRRGFFDPRTRLGVPYTESRNSIARSISASRPFKLSLKRPVPNCRKGLKGGRVGGLPSFCLLAARALEATGTYSVTAPLVPLTILLESYSYVLRWKLCPHMPYCGSIGNSAIAPFILRGINTFPILPFLPNLFLHAFTMNTTVTYPANQPVQFSNPGQAVILQLMPTLKDDVTHPEDTPVTTHFVVARSMETSANDDRLLIWIHVLAECHWESKPSEVEYHFTVSVIVDKRNFDTASDLINDVLLRPKLGGNRVVKKLVIGTYLHKELLNPGQEIKIVGGPVSKAGDPPTNRDYHYAPVSWTKHVVPARGKPLSIQPSGQPSSAQALDMHELLHLVS
ncbi:hypothetical protein CPB85DRAFT_1257335 [Mucidula mucida]|nr:hypothetical protein CPB85DRAFT_1257335 [Mucidula mucida]